MKSGNKLNDAFKSALEDQPAPLREGQWEELRKALDEKKKRRFLPWLFFIIPALICSIGLSYYFGRQSVITENKKVQSAVPQTEKTETPANNSSLDSLQESTVHEENMTESPSPESPSLAQSGDRSIENKSGAQANLPTQVESGKNARSKEAGVLPEAKQSGSAHLKEIVALPPAKKDSVVSETPTIARTEGVLLPDEIKKPELPLEPSPAQDSIGIKIADSDSLKKEEKKRKKSKSNAAGNAVPRFVLGFASGYSMVYTDVVGISNEQKLHKDSRSLFEKSTDQQSSIFANLIFEWNPVANLNLGLSSGIQVRDISNQTDMDYKLNQIPIRYPNGDIWSYIPVSDSNALTISIKNRTSFYFVNIPLKLAYSAIVRSKNEFRLSGGVNFSFLAGSSGNTFSLNEARSRPVKEMVSEIYNLGFGAGLMYSRQIYKQWWLGFEAELQSNPLKYDLDYGILSSRISMRNYNLNIRYKF